MRNALPFLAVIALAALFGSGCAGPEQKLGLGISNTCEIVRLGEMQRSIEQAEIFDPSGPSYATGFVTGFDRTIARTGMGIFQIVTFPIPSYGPIWTDYLSPNPAHPASYTADHIASSTFDTDTYTGFSGGDVAPFVPGSRFNIFN